jgi:SAM-dependent methyltransferase
MAVACPVDLDTGRLRQEIQAIYARVATDPSSEFHFHRGPGYAAERLGYDAGALAAIPEWATASFAGVANPLRMAALAPGATVVDIGCGAGMDLMLAASAVGPGGKAIGIDMTEPMAERARAAARALGFPTSRFEPETPWTSRLIPAVSTSSSRTAS